MQLEFEVDNVINLVPTQTLHWNVEYPAGPQTPSRQTEKVSHLYISNADIQGIVPLAEVRGEHDDQYKMQTSMGRLITLADEKLLQINTHFSPCFPPCANLLLDTHAALSRSKT